MKTKHTKGEWKVEDIRQYRLNYDYDYQVSVDGNWICNVDKHIKEHKANAKLIAAAPDMLDALIIAKSELLGDHIDSDWESTLDLIEEVIKKATS